MYRYLAAVLIASSACTAVERAEEPSDAAPSEPDASDSITAEDASFSTLIGVAMTGKLEASASRGTFIYRIAELPENGTLDLLDDETGEFRYTPTATGSIERFTFFVTDLTRESSLAEVTIQVNTAAADQLELTGPSSILLPASNLYAYPNCLEYTLTRRGNIQFRAGETAVQLAGPASFETYDDSVCEHPTAIARTVAIPAGADQVQLWLRITLAGDHTLIASAPTFSPANHPLEVIAGYPAQIQLRPDAAPASIQACIPVSARFYDAWGNPSASWVSPFATGRFHVWWDSYPISGGGPATFYSDSSCEVAFPENYATPATEVSFYTRLTGDVSIRGGFGQPGLCNDNTYRVCSGALTFDVP